MFILCLFLADPVLSQLPWEVWSWSIPQQPIEHFFRKSEKILIKMPTKDCECPPNDKCEMDFQIDDGTAIYLRMKSVINDEDLQVIKNQKDIEDSRRSSRKTLKKRAVGDCCCPPVNFDMPTFITDKKFHEYIERFDKKRDTPKIEPHRRALVEFQD